MAMDITDDDVFNGMAMLGGFDEQKKVSINMDTLCDEDTMRRNEQDVPASSPSGTDVYGVPQTQITTYTHNYEDDYNAGIVHMNLNMQFEEQMQTAHMQNEIVYNQGMRYQNQHEHQQQVYHDMTGYNSDANYPIQTEYNPQCTNNFHYAQPAQSVYSGNEPFYQEGMSQQNFDVSNIGAPVMVDANGQPFYNQPQHVKYYEGPTLQPVQFNHPAQPVEQQPVDFSNIAIVLTQPPARYRKRCNEGKFNEATPSKRQSPPRAARNCDANAAYFSEEFSVPDAEVQTPSTRRGRGMAGTSKQTSVQRHRQSIKDFLDSAPSNIESLKVMNNVVDHANEELHSMIYILQEMLDCGLVPDRDMVY